MRELHIKNAENGAESVVRDRLEAIVQELGFDHGTFGITGLPDATVFAVTTYPEAWLRRYQERQYHLHDPTIHVTMRSRRPVDWAALRPFDPVGIFQDFEDHGLGRNGISVPVQGGQGETAILSASSSIGPGPAWRTMYQRSIVRLQYACVELHQTALTAWNISARLGLGTLTGQQSRILQLVAAGKTLDEIAAIVDVRRRTVEYHCTEIRRKLKANTMHQAVARAIGLGIIFPA